MAHPLYGKVQNRQSDDREGKLSKRSEMVLRLMATGLTAKQVADELFVCERTVNTYTYKAYRALNVHNLQAALLAAGIVTINEPR